MPDEIIWIVTDDRPQPTITGEKGWGVGDLPLGLQRVPVDFGILQQEWDQTLRLVGQLIKRADQSATATSRMQLDEVTLAVEISGKGQVSLLGVGGEASSKGAITLKFKRVEVKQNGEELGDRDRH